MYQLALLFMKFILFSMMGYVAEMIMCCIVEKKLTNRGFLCGPVIPIYGVGSIFLIFFLSPFKESPILVFLLGMIITTVIEYLTSYALEKIFHNKWWDYSNQKYNINGRICLLNSILFGIGSILIIYFINPWISKFLLEIKDNYLIITTIILLIIFIIDTIYSMLVAYSLRNRLIVVEQLKNDKLAKIPGLLEKMLAKQMKKFKGLKKKSPARLLRAFPTLFTSNQKEFDIMKKISLKEKQLKKKRKKQKAKKKKRLTN